MVRALSSLLVLDIAGTLGYTIVISVQNPIDKPSEGHFDEICFGARLPTLFSIFDMQSSASVFLCTFAFGSKFI